MVLPHASPEALRVLRALPKPKATGNAALDGDAEASREMLAQILEHCLRDPRHTVALHSSLLKRLRAGEQQGAARMSATVVARVPEEVRIDTICQVSDLTAADVVLAKKADWDSDRQLLTFATGLGPSARLPHCMQQVAVFQRVCAKLASRLGHRLSKFKAAGGVCSQSGRVNWALGVYTLDFTADGKLASVRHIGGLVVETPVWAQHICREYDLNDNWNDWTAHLERKPAPPIYLRTFFQGNAGPHSVLLCKGGSSKELEAMAAEADKVYQQELKRVSAAASSGDNEVQGELKNLQKERAQEASTKARAKALETLVQKKAQRRISLGALAAPPK